MILEDTLADATVDDLMDECRRRDIVLLTPRDRREWSRAYELLSAGRTDEALAWLRVQCMRHTGRVL